MSHAMTPIRLTQKALTPRSVTANDKDSFLHFYTDGRPDTVFVPVADFLAWKSINVRSDIYPHKIPAKDWTFAYRNVAVSKYNEDGAAMHIKKSINGVLLFDLVV